MFEKNKTRLPWLAITFLVAIHLVALYAGFFAPYDYSEQNRSLALAPPARLHFVDSQNHFHLRPFVYQWVPRPDRFGEHEEDRGRMYPLRFLVRGDEGRFFGFLSTRMEEREKLEAANDDVGLSLLVASQRLLLVPSGTKVKVLEVRESKSCCQVRILEGEHFAKTALVPRKYLARYPNQ